MDRMLKTALGALCVMAAIFLSAGISRASEDVAPAPDAKTPAAASGSPVAAPPTEATAEAKTEVKTAALSIDEDEFLGIKDIFIQGFPVKEVPFVKAPVEVSAPSEVAAEKAFTTKGLTVTGLVWGHPDAKAIINGEVYSIGDTINDGKIMSIDADGIVVRYLSKDYLWKRENAIRSS